MINFLKRLFGKHDNYGLRHDSAHLSDMQRKIAFLTVEEQSKYADKVCVERINDKRFILSQFSGLDVNDTSFFTGINATAIGNMAYVHLNAPIPEVRDKALAVIKNYQTWIKSF